MCTSSGRWTVVARIAGHAPAFHASTAGPRLAHVPHITGCARSHFPVNGIVPYTYTYGIQVVAGKAHAIALGHGARTYVSRAAYSLLRTAGGLHVAVFFRPATVGRHVLAVCTATNEWIFS